MAFFSTGPRGRKTSTPPTSAAATTSTVSPTVSPTESSAVLDSAHVGDIVGALGTIKQGDTGERKTWWQRLRRSSTR